MSKEKKNWRGPDLILRLELGGRVIHEGRVTELTFPLQIGRKSVCVWNVPVEERSVSGLHAELSVRKGKELVIRDIGSRNGIFVMGARVTEQRLAAGVQVTIGQCRLSVDSFRDADDGNKLKYHRLEQLTGPGASRFFDLKKTVTKIGSGAADGVLCADLLVSKEHAEIVRKADDSCWIKDLGSKNGTRVNQIPVKNVERMLCNGDVITIADIEFKFQDRTIPPPDPIWRKVVIAVVTMSLCGMCYFAYQWIFPSAKVLIKESQAYEMRGEFALAKSVLDKAVTARGGDEDKDEINRKRDDLDRWVDTLTVWDGVCRDFGRRYWIPASKNLGYLLDSGIDRWGWNTTTAHELKKQARTMYSLIQIFLESRKAFGGDLPDEARGREIEYLAEQCDALQAALRNPEWTKTLPTGKLREDMEELRNAVSAIVDDLTKIERLIRMIKSPTDDHLFLKEVISLTEKFNEISTLLEKIGETAKARERQREDDAKSAGRRFVTSPIVMQRCDTFIPALKKFIESRQMLVSNVGALVAFDEKKLKREIAYPSDQQCSIHPAFGEIRRAMEMANREICGDLQRTMRDQVGRLNRWGLDKGAVPSCIQLLLSEDVMAKVLRCDTIDGVYCKADRTQRSGQYDRILGVEEFANYLTNITEDRSYPDSPGDAPSPSISDAIRFYRQSTAFIKYLEHPNIAYLLAFENGTENKLKALADKVVSLEEKKALLIDLWFNNESGTRRERIIAKGAAMALDGGRQFGEDEGKDMKKELKALRDELQDLKRKLDADPERVSEYRPAMLAIGIPRLMGINRYWEQERKLGGTRSRASEKEDAR